MLVENDPNLIIRYKIKCSLMRRRSRYLLATERSPLPASYDVDTISRLRGAAPFTYDLAASQLKNTRQHAWRSPGFTSECRRQLTYDPWECDQSESERGRMREGFKSAEKIRGIIIMKRGIVDRLIISRRLNKLRERRQMRPPTHHSPPFIYIG